MKSAAPNQTPLALPGSLFGAGEPSVASTAWQTIDLGHDSWLELGPGLLLGADTLFEHLRDQLPFRQGQRTMWGNRVDEPRLSCGLELSSAPPPVADLAATFSSRYGLAFNSCFVNFYRDGRDSVAWHADRDGRVSLNPLVAIVSLGGPRRFGVRPKGGGPQRGFTLYSGDAIVMGGACQHRFEHCVPKMKFAPPRMSLSFRHR